MKCEWKFFKRRLYLIGILGILLVQFVEQCHSWWMGWWHIPSSCKYHEDLYNFNILLVFSFNLYFCLKMVRVVSTFTYERVSFQFCASRNLRLARLLLDPNWQKVNLAEKGECQEWVFQKSWIPSFLLFWLNTEEKNILFGKILEVVVTCYSI